MSYVLPLVAVPVASALLFIIYDAARFSTSGDTGGQWIVFPEAVLILPGMLIIVAAFASILGMQMSLRCRTTVRAVDPPDMLELHVRARPFLEAVVRFEVAASPTGCRLSMRETPVGIYKGISALAQPLIRARNERSLQRLKAHLESPSSAASTATKGAAHLTGQRQARQNREEESTA